MSERTIAGLQSHGKRVFVYCRTNGIAKIFLKQAFEEGVTFWDGADPQERQPHGIFEIHGNFTIKYEVLFRQPELHHYRQITVGREGIA